MLLPATRAATVSIDSLSALVFAFMAIMFKIRIYSWLTCLLSFSSLANQRYSSMDSKSVVATLSLIVLTFISTHVSLKGQPVMAPMLPWLQRG